MAGRESDESYVGRYTTETCAVRQKEIKCKCKSHVYVLSAANAMPARLGSCSGLSTAPLPPLRAKCQSEVRSEDGVWA